MNKRFNEISHRSHKTCRRNKAPNTIRHLLLSNNTGTPQSHCDAQWEGYIILRSKLFWEYCDVFCDVKPPLVGFEVISIHLY